MKGGGGGWGTVLSVCCQCVKGGGGGTVLSICCQCVKGGGGGGITKSPV